MQSTSDGITLLLTTLGDDEHAVPAASRLYRAVSKVNAECDKPVTVVDRMLTALVTVRGEIFPSLEFRTKFRGGVPLFGSTRISLNEV